MFKKAAMLVTVVMGLVVLLTGCSKAPVAEQKAAMDELSLAQKQQVEQYAPEAWKLVQDSLEAAKAMMAEQDERFSLFRDYDDVRAMYQRIGVFAQQAGNEAQAELARVRTETSNMISEALAETNSLSEMLITFPVTKDTKADIEMLRRDTEALQVMINEARAKFDRAEYGAARSVLQSVLDRVTDLKAGVQVAQTRVGIKTKA